MLLSARVLNPVADVNNFQVADQAVWTVGDTVSVYLQLIDASVDTQSNPPGRRYMPAAGATLQVKINSFDAAKTYTKTATQPFAQDPSIWRIDILASDKIVGTRDLVLALTESSVVRNGRVRSAISVHDTQETI